MSNSLRPHGLQRARFPCPSPSPGACSNSCPLSRWCHPTMSSSVVPFFSRLQSFPASGSFPKSQFFESSGQSIGVSASAELVNVTCVCQMLTYPEKCDLYYNIKLREGIETDNHYSLIQLPWESNRFRSFPQKSSAVILLPPAYFSCKGTASPKGSSMVC